MPVSISVSLIALVVPFLIQAGETAVPNKNTSQPSSEYGRFQTSGPQVAKGGVSAAEDCQSLEDCNRFRYKIAESILALKKSPDFGDLIQDFNNVKKKPVFNYNNAVDQCSSQGKRLPTVREWANLSVAFGAKGILEVSEFRQKKAAGENVDDFELIGSRTMDNSKADWFYFSDKGYKRPIGRLGQKYTWFWTLSNLADNSKAFLQSPDIKFTFSSRTGVISSDWAYYPDYRAACVDEQLSYKADVCKTMPDCLELRDKVVSRILVLQKRPEFGEIVKRNANSEKYCYESKMESRDKCKMNLRNAEDYCRSQQKRLPTAREFALLSMSFGAKGILEVEEYKRREAAGEDLRGFSLVGSANGSTIDHFYFSSSGFEPPIGQSQPVAELGTDDFWSSSKESFRGLIYDGGFEFSSFHLDLKGNYFTEAPLSVLCIADR